MIQKLRGNQKGFTLIELMIVIAIIGILAAIAVPQFMAYRMRGYHTVAAGDVRNWVAAESALFEDGACYGISDTAADLLSAAGVPGAVGALGTLILGGSAPIMSVVATGTSPGTVVTGTRQNGALNDLIFAFPISVGDDVKLRADVSGSGTNPPYNDSYIISGEHRKGIRAFGADSDVTNTVFFVQNETWANRNPIALNCIVPAAITGGAAGTDGFTNDGAGFDGGGGANANWEVLK